MNKAYMGIHEQTCLEPEKYWVLFVKMGIDPLASLGQESCAVNGYFCSNQFVLLCIYGRQVGLMRNPSQEKRMLSDELYICASP